MLIHVFIVLSIHIFLSNFAFMSVDMCMIEWGKSSLVSPKKHRPERSLVGNSGVLLGVRKSMVTHSKRPNRKGFLCVHLGIRLETQSQMLNIWAFCGVTVFAVEGRKQRVIDKQLQSESPLQRNGQ